MARWHKELSEVGNQSSEVAPFFGFRLCFVSSRGGSPCKRGENLRPSRTVDSFFSYVVVPACFTLCHLFRPRCSLFFFCAVQHCSRILAFNFPPNPSRQLGLHLDRSVTIQPRRRHISSMSNTLEDLTTKVCSHIQHVAFVPVERTMWPSLSRLGGKYFFQSSLRRCSARRTSCPRREWTVS